MGVKSGVSSKKSHGVRADLRERRPREILDAANEEFSESGFAAARIDDIAQRAGVSKGTIYLYFETKDELFRAMVRSLIQPTFVRFEQILSSADRAMVTMERLLLALYENGSSDPRSLSLPRFLVMEGARFPDLVRLYRDEISMRSNVIFGEVMRRGVASGEMHPNIPVDCPQVITAAWVAYAIHIASYGDDWPFDRDEYMKSHIGMVLRGLKA